MGISVNIGSQQQQQQQQQQKQQQQQQQRILPQLKLSYRK